VLLEFFELASVYVRFKSQVIRYGASQGDNLRYLVFHERAHLKIEIGMLAVSLGHAVLSDEDEGGQENSFDRGNGTTENREGWIPAWNYGDQADVYYYPEAEP
jgi:hypothetical protein